MIREYVEILVFSVKLIIKNRFLINLVLRSSVNKLFMYVKVFKKVFINLWNYFRFIDFLYWGIEFRL